MRRSRLVVGLAVLVVLVVGAALGSWLGARSESGAAPPNAGAAPIVAIAPGAPEAVEPLDLPLGDSGSGLAALDAVLTPDGRTLLTVDTDGRLTIAGIGPDPASRRVERVATGTPQPLGLNGAAQTRHALALAPDGRTIWVTDGWGRRVQVVDLPTRTIQGSVAIPAVPTTVAIAGNSVAVGDATGALTTLDAATRRLLAFRDIADGPVAELVASPDQRHVVVAADPGGDYGPGSVIAVDLTNPSAPRMPYSWPVTRPRALGGTSMLISPDSTRAYVITGPRLGAAGPDAATTGGVVVLDIRAGREVTNLPGLYANALALSPDGRRLYLARSPETPTASAAQPQLAIDAFDITDITTTLTTPGSDNDSGPPARRIGSITDQLTTYSPPQLLPSPDGHRLYALTYNAAAVALRSP